MRRIALIAALAAAASFCAFGAAPASAGQPCWRTLINDWYDGHIDGTYPLSCYRAALKNMPEDLRIYSSLPADLERAMQALTAGPRSTSSVHTSSSSNNSSESQAQTHIKDARHMKKSSTTRKPAKSQTKVPPGPGRKVSDGPIGHALDLAASKPDSIPIPLLVLAGLGLVLVATGTAGMATRRLRARRVRVFPPDDPPL